MVVMATFFKRTCTRTVVFSAPDPMVGHCQPMPLLGTPGHSQASLAQSLVRPLLLSPGSRCTQSFICALQESVSPVLWKFCNQIPLAFKVRFPGDSLTLCQTPRLGNQLWALELLHQCETFSGRPSLISKTWVRPSVVLYCSHLFISTQEGENSCRYVVVWLIFFQNLLPRSPPLTIKSKRKKQLKWS